MGFFNSIYSFVSDKKKIHQALFILPLLTFYLTKQPEWLFFSGLIILAIMEVYKSDLEGKIQIFIQKRVQEVSKNKPLLRNYKEQLKDAGKEFNYIFAWWFFAIVSVLFIAEFFYSAYVSFGFSKILFGIHLFLIVYFIFLDLIIAKNIKLLAENKTKKTKKRK